jgi:hypothetical protein
MLVATAYGIYCGMSTTRPAGGRGTNQYRAKERDRPAPGSTLLVDPHLLDLPRGVEWDDLEDIEKFNVQYGFGLVKRRPSEPARAFRERQATIKAQQFVRGNLGIKPDTADKAGRMQGAVLEELGGPVAVSFRRADRKEGQPELGARWVGVYHSTVAIIAHDPDQQWDPLSLSKVHAELGLTQGIKHPVSRAGAILNALAEAQFLDKEYDGGPDRPVYRLAQSWRQAKLGTEKNCGPAVMAVLAQHGGPMSLDDVAMTIWERGYIQENCEHPMEVTVAAAATMCQLGLIRRLADGRYQVADGKIAPTIYREEQ